MPDWLPKSNRSSSPVLPQESELRSLVMMALNDLKEEVAFIVPKNLERASLQVLPKKI